MPVVLQADQRVPGGLDLEPLMRQRPGVLLGAVLSQLQEVPPVEALKMEARMVDPAQR